MDSISGIGQDVMGKDQFLRLFTAQMRMQDPMNPTEGSDLLAQLAQFSSVEQMTNLNSNFEKMLATQQALQATNLVGKVVSYQDPASALPGQGRVTGVLLTADGPALMLGNRHVNLDWVTGVYEE